MEYQVGNFKVTCPLVAKEVVGVKVKENTALVVPNVFTLVSRLMVDVSIDPFTKLGEKAIV